MTDPPLILNVDDYDTNRYVRSGLLRRAGYRVIEASGGREALARVSADRPDLVVLDVQMPDLDGLEVCRVIRANEGLASTLILHVSATAIETGNVVAGLDNGADGYLTDAADPMVLLATVRALLRMRRAEEERNEARARLAETEGRLARMLQNMSDVVYRYRLLPDAGFEYVSPSIMALLGYAPDEFYADPDLGWKTIHPDDAVAADRLQRFDGDRQTYTLRHVARDGRTVCAEHRVAAVRDEQGRVVALEGVARDVTAQRTIQEELRRANQMKDEFLATLSHELRTPLNAIVGWSQMLMSGKLTAELTDRAVDSIARNADAQRQLINDVLDVSRIVAGKMRIDVRPLDLGAIVRAAVDALRPAADAKQIAVSVEVPPEPVPLAGDADRLQQVFWNLLSNAVKFTPTRGRVNVRLQVDGESARVDVQDSGAGIPPWFLPHIFERFTQADSAANRRHHGLGLGLALVRHLVELHGGTVSAESAGEGCGATLRVNLPLSREQWSYAPMGSARRAAAGQGGEPLHGVKVLLVDDEIDSRHVIGAALRQAGADVSEADSTATALSMLPLVMPDVLVSDIGMPGQDGYQLMRLVRTLSVDAGGDVPAIALTAYGREMDRQRALDAGYQAHLPKPVLPDDLTREVAALVRRRVA